MRAHVGSYCRNCLVPIGALGLTLFGIDIYFNQSLSIDQALIGPIAFINEGGNLRVMIDIVMLGISGGIYIVPLYALIQQRSELKKRSRIIAANNVLNALFMVVAALYGLFALSSGITVPTLFLILALMNLAVTLFIFKLVPEFIMRLLIWLVIHTVYRVDKINLDKIPDSGPAVLICNHVSYVDALILAGCIKRPVRFVMYYRIYQLPILSFVFKTANAIPIGGGGEHAGLTKLAFNRVSEALNDGEPTMC